MEREFWRKNFEEVALHEVDTWDRQWIYHIYVNNGFGITPNVNLVTNMGFGPHATHTHQIDHPAANAPSNSLKSIKHPAKIRIAKKADRFTYKKLDEGNNTRFNLIKFRIGKKLPLIKTLYLRAKKILNFFGSPQING